MESGGLDDMGLGGLVAADERADAVSGGGVSAVRDTGGIAVDVERSRATRSLRGRSTRGMTSTMRSPIAASRDDTTVDLDVA
ncbi:MAG: hypothetical protein ACJ79A_21605 [Gemmatimonadaceae bacterium]